MAFLGLKQACHDLANDVQLCRFLLLDLLLLIVLHHLYSSQHFRFLPQLVPAASRSQVRDLEVLLEPYSCLCLVKLSRDLPLLAASWHCVRDLRDLDFSL